MTLFRLYLLALLIILSGYTLVVIGDYGMNLFAVFFGDMAAVAWPGQFNLDFMMMLSFSALWVAWRHAFSASGLGLAVLAFFGGALFLTLYLSALCAKGADARTILIGDRA